MDCTNSTFEIDAMLRSIASRQLGLITVAQADHAGIERTALARRREAEALVPVFAGVMRLGSAAPTASQRILAGALAVPGSVITATSAAVVHEMPALPGQDSQHAAPVVSVSSNRSARTQGIVTIRQKLQLPSRPWLTGRVATPAATLLLLPRFVEERLVERCLDHCLAHRLTTVAAVRRLIEQVPARAVHGRAMLLELLAQRAGGIGHRSGLEQIVAGWLNDAGLTGWAANYRVAVSTGRHIEVDFAWPAHKVALEVSPFFTHGARVNQERDMQRRRELVERGWRLAEASDRDLETRVAFGGTAALLRGLLRGAGPALLCAV